MIIESNYEIANQEEEISFNTKIFESLNKKEYRKKLQEIENRYLTLNFKTFTEKELNFLENVSIKTIDKQCYLTLLQTELSFDYTSNINNHYIYLNYKTLNKEILEKYNFDNLGSNFNNFYIKITDDNNTEYFKILEKIVVTINNKKYWRFNVNSYNINNITHNYLLNNYLKDITKVSYIINTEIQNKNIDIKKTFKKDGEVKLKFKIIQESGKF